MGNEKNTHLSTDQLLKAIVDEGELSPEMRNHLADCPQCQKEKKKTERHLDALSQTAKRMVPATSRTVRLPEKKIPTSYWKGLRLRPVYAMATVILFVVIAVWWPGRFESTPEPDQIVMVYELQEEEQLMIDVGMVVENALPEAYQNVLTVFETEPEEDFMQFIVPSEESDDSTSLFHKKGEEPC